MATLLPNGKQVFVDANGSPLAGGSVQFFVPGTTTPKDTYQDPGATILNANPVILDAAGRATIYGSGSYRQIVRDVSGNTIWDQLTQDSSSFGSSWSGTSAGTANVQTVTAVSFTSSNGQTISFIAGLTNTASFSLNPNGSGPIAVLKDTPEGPTALTGGEIVAGNVVTVVYDTGLGSFHLANLAAPGKSVSLASASTTDLGTAKNPVVSITGTNGITAFGSSASVGAPLYYVTFAGVLTITHNATSLILPGAANITTAAGDAAILLYLGSGNWQMLFYQRASQAPAATTPANPVNLKIQVTGDTAATLTADAVVVTDGVSFKALQSVSRTLGTGATGADGLDTGTVANSTWYAVWAIAKPDGTQAGLLSTSSTSPTMPTGYTYKSRVGWVLTDSTGKLYRTLQRNKRVQYVIGTLPTSYRIICSGSGGNVSTPTWTAQSVSNFVPTTAVAIHVMLFAGNSAGTAIAGPNNAGGAYTSSSNPPALLAFVSGSAQSNANDWLLLESTNLYYASSTASSGLACLGWEDA